MNFLRNMMGHNSGDNQPRRPRNPNIPDLGQHETKRILERTLDNLPASGDIVQFEDQQLIQHHPRRDDIILTHDPVHEVVRIQFDCQADAVPIFGTVESMTGFVLDLYVAEDLQHGDYTRTGGCLPTDNMMVPCVDVKVYADQGETVASRVQVERHGNTLTARVAAIVWILSDADGEIALFAHVGARFENIVLPELP